jgi:hypothetical protein
MNRRAQTLIETNLKIVKNIFDLCPFIFLCFGENFIVLSRFDREISAVDEFVDVIFCSFVQQSFSIKQYRQSLDEVKAKVKTDWKSTIPV